MQRVYNFEANLNLVIDANFLNSRTKRISIAHVGFVLNVLNGFWGCFENALLPASPEQPRTARSARAAQSGRSARAARLPSGRFEMRHSIANRYVS
jgi:hypothetical protein